MDPGTPKTPDASSSHPREVSDTVPTQRTIVSPVRQSPVTVDALLLPPQRPDEIGRLGRYRVLGELGRGGMGVVYRAEDPHLQRLVALKVLLPELAANPRARARFVREARAQARVEHDHIIPIHDVVEADGVAFLVMPLLKGQSLAQALKQNPRPPLAEVIRIGEEIAEGLSAAHAAGLIHRDIKPANVWLEGNKRRVKILDFGVARSVAAPGSGTQPTAGGSIVGSPAYMPPEQARSEPVDARADLFSLGVVLYEMTTGRRPFTGPSVFEVLAAVVSDHPPTAHEVNPDVPLPLSGLIWRLMAKSPADRPATAEAVAQELAALTQGPVALPVRIVPLPDVPGEPDPWADIATRGDGDESEGDETIAMDHLAPAPGRGAPVWVWPAVAVALMLAVVGGLLVAKPWKARPRAPVVQEPNPTQTPLVTPVPPPKEAPDRKAAEWALSLDRGVGYTEVTVRTGGKEVSLFSNDPLPPGPLELVNLTLRDKPNLTGEGLENLRDCAHLEKLSLQLSPVGDAGLARLRGLTALVSLNLDYTRVTGRGLAALKDSTRVEVVVAEEVELGDGVAALAETFPALRYARVTRTRVTAAGLKRFEEVRGKSVLELAPPDRPSVGLVFDGTTGVRVPDFRYDGALPLTIETWVTPTEVTGKHQFLCRMGEPGAGPSISLEGRLGMTFPIGPSGEDKWAADYSGDVLTAGKLTHLAVVVTTTHMRLFADGKQIGHKPIKVERLPECVGMVLGMGTRAAGGGQRFRGVMHGLRVSRVARYGAGGFAPTGTWAPDADTLALYRFDEHAEAALIDCSGNGRNGKIEGGVWAAAAPTVGLAFDGTSAFVTVPGLSFDGKLPLTIEAWVTPEALRESHIFLLGEPGGGIGLGKTGQFGGGLKTADGWAEALVAKPLERGKPVHVAAVFTDTRFVLFVDGHRVGEKDVELGVRPPVAPPAVIGKATDAVGGKEHFHGLIHGVRVSRGMRYDREFTPTAPVAWYPDADTVALYRFDDGAGAKLTDRSGRAFHGEIVDAKWVAPKKK